MNKKNQGVKILNKPYTENEPHVFILNKVFDGSYTEKEGNIAHEIIDFIKTDEDELYFYNNPWGTCPDNIFTDKTYKKSNNKKQNNYITKYMLICSPNKMNNKKGNNGEKYISRFYIKYVAEIEEILHHHSRANPEKNFGTLSNVRKDIIDNIIRKRKIKYSGKYLDEIFKNDTSLLVTFKVKKVWAPIENLIEFKANEYRFQRNKGYIWSDKYPNDYNEIIKSLQKEEWKEVKFTNITNKASTLYTKKTFLNLILKTDSEDCYTNILKSILSADNIMNLFCKEFDTKRILATSFSPQNVEREKVVEGGRMDICADNGQQRVIIENKLFSGLNGIKEEDKISQLDSYYNWGTENGYYAPLCFITCPNFRKEEIKAEIADKCSQMKNVYEIVEYSKIADFILRNKNNLKNYIYINYIDDIISIFNNYGYPEKNEFFAQLFLDAIKN